jgi:hypothetical protein
MKVSVKTAAIELGMKEATLRTQIYRGVHYGPFFDLVDGEQMADLEDLIDYVRPEPPLYKVHKIGVRFDDIELARLKANANGRPLATYIRGRVL